MCVFLCRVILLLLLLSSEHNNSESSCNLQPLSKVGFGFPFLPTILFVPVDQVRSLRSGFRSFISIIRFLLSFSSSPSYISVAVFFLPSDSASVRWCLDLLVYFL